MKHEDLVALAKQAGIVGNERLYDWCYTYHSSREFDDSYKQAFRLDITPEMLKFGWLVAEAARKPTNAHDKVYSEVDLANAYQKGWNDAMLRRSLDFRARSNP